MCLMECMHLTRHVSVSGAMPKGALCHSDKQMIALETVSPTVYFDMWHIVHEAIWTERLINWQIYYFADNLRCLLSQICN